MAHTAQADNNSFVGPVLQPGKSFAQTFSSVGSVPYFCQFHGAAGGVGMSGSVIVTAAQNAPPPAAASATTQTTTFVSTSTVQTQLQAEVQVLQQVLAQLVQQRLVSGGSGAPASSACSAITAPLQQGATGLGVSQLQSFLARDASIYPQGTVSGFFGLLTQAAVQRFQAKNGIVSSGSPASTGYGKVGPRTAAAVIAQCGGGAGGSGSSSSTAGMTATDLSGFIHVSPVSGPAPLTVSVETNVNIDSDCGSAIYTVDFGDGAPPQQIQVAAGVCSTAQQTYTHTYANKGNYLITLSAGPIRTRRRWWCSSR